MDLSPLHMSEGPPGILLTSESHAQLFNHDEKIIGRSNEQLEAANETITVLEGKLREVSKDYDFAFNQLYESEMSRSNKAVSRIALQRHLRLELQIHSMHAQAYQSLELQHRKTVAELDSTKTLNEMWLQEVVRDKRVIDSMNRKILEYESGGLELSEFGARLSRTSNWAGRDAIIASLAPSDKSSLVLPAGSMSAKIIAAPPAADLAFMKGSPHISTAHLTPRDWQELTWTSSEQDTVPEGTSGSLMTEVMK